MDNSYEYNDPQSPDLVDSSGHVLMSSEQDSEEVVQLNGNNISSNVLKENRMTANQVFKKPPEFKVYPLLDCDQSTKSSGFVLSVSAMNIQFERLALMFNSLHDEIAKLQGKINSVEMEIKKKQKEKTKQSLREQRSKKEQEHQKQQFMCMVTGCNKVYINYGSLKTHLNTKHLNLSKGDVEQLVRQQQRNQKQFMSQAI